MPQMLQRFDSGPALTEARAAIARFREPPGPEDTGIAWLLPTGLPPLHRDAGHAFVRGMIKRYALWQPMNMTEVCAWARDGSDEAELALIDLIAEFIERGERLPVALAAYNLELIHPRRPARIKGPKKAAHVVQDLAIVVTIMLVMERSGLKATRRQSAQPSACSIVAQALKEAGLHRGGEKAVEKIWQKYSPAILRGYRWNPHPQLTLTQPD